MSDARFDRAIDEAVREMLDVEQPAGFRARVLRRIEARSLPPEGGSYKRFLWAALPIAAAAILILAVLLPRTIEEPQQTPPPATTTVHVEEPASPRTRIVEPPRVASTPLRGRATRPTSERLVAATTYTSAPSVDTDIAPLKTIVPIEVAAVAQRPITQEEITLRPLNPITELQIAPLTPPDGRN